MKVCGRCGEKMQRDDGTPITRTFTIRGPGGAEFEICLKCSKSFDVWLGRWLTVDAVTIGRSVPDGSDPWTSRIDPA